MKTGVREIQVNLHSIKRDEVLVDGRTAAKQKLLALDNQELEFTLQDGTELVPAVVRLQRRDVWTRWTDSIRTLQLSLDGEVVYSEGETDGG